MNLEFESHKTLEFNQVVSTHYNELTKSETAICRLHAEERREAAFWSAAEIAITGLKRGYFGSVCPLFRLCQFTCYAKSYKRNFRRRLPTPHAFVAGLMT